MQGTVTQSSLLFVSIKIKSKGKARGAKDKAQKMKEVKEGGAS